MQTYYDDNYREEKENVKRQRDRLEMIKLLMEAGGHDVLVVDNGSGSIKAGLSSHSEPTVIPSVLGTLNRRGLRSNERDFYIADQIEEAPRSFLNLTYPIHHGIITEWDAMEKIMAYTFDRKLEASARDYPVLLSEPSINLKQYRAKLAELMFETACVPMMYLASQCELDLYAYDRQTGVVLDSGDELTQVVPFFQGKPVVSAITNSNFGGKDLSKYLLKLLKEKGYSVSSRIEESLPNELKQKLGYVALDYDKEIKTAASSSALEKTYEFDFNEYKLNAERFKCAEPLFKPSLLEKKWQGVHELIHDSIQKCDPSIRSQLYSSILLAGGSTMFSGFKERLKKELSELNPGVNINIIDDPERKYFTWKGGVKLATSSKFQSQKLDGWITINDYEEYGYDVVYDKCGENIRYLEDLEIYNYLD